MKQVNLSEIVAIAAQLAGQKIDRSRLDELGSCVDRVQANVSTSAALRAAWKAAGLVGRIETLASPTPAHVPFIGWHPDQGWFAVVAQNANRGWKAMDATGKFRELTSLVNCECLSIPSKSGASRQQPSAAALVRQAMMRYRGSFFDGLLATTLANFLALAASLYSMQVYDRVIPNHGHQTLWVLSVGVVLATLLELFIKQARGVTIERACKTIDCELSEWFFQRALAIRMEGRPGSVGTLAAQIKGFELVRTVMTSSSIFVLVDVPFAILFVVVIALVGGVLALVPIVTLLIALIAGWVFQRLIASYALQNHGQGTRKTGLLVESIDGAESLKASGAEWKFMARWHALSRAAADSEFELKRLTLLSQNFSSTLQQLGYIAIVAAGAYLASDNLLTMGAVIGCSIISNRAMMPFAQLPAVMAQWEQARAALGGLDQVIGLPNEIDEQTHFLAPQKLECSFRFERVSFVYGIANQSALDIPQLSISAGQRIAILGGIGSGKSTLLKIASGLYRPTDGKLFIGGVDAALLSPTLLREVIGYLPQDFQLFSGTLRENLLMGLPDPGDDAILEAAKATGIIELISGQPKGLALEIFEGGRGVSGGQKQLIGLTRLVLAKPQVWVLDEPTSSMDAKAEMRIVNLLGRIASSGATMLIATHKTALLPLMDHLVTMHGGRIAVQGPRDVVLAKMSEAARQIAAAPEGGAVP